MKRIAITIAAVAMIYGNGFAQGKATENFRSAQLLFKVPIGSFYADKKMPALFKQYVHSVVGPLVPVSFAVTDSLVYLPNIPEGKIKVYNKEGIFRKDIKLPENVKPNNFDLMAEGKILISNAKEKQLYELTPDGIISAQKKVFGWPFYVSQKDNDYIYQNDTGAFADRDKKITGGIIWGDPLNKYNYILSGDTLMLSYAHVGNAFVFGYKMFTLDGKMVREGRFDNDQMLRNYTGLTAIGDKGTYYILMLTDGRVGADPLMLKLGKSSGNYKTETLKNPLPTTNPVVGENISYFPDGVIYKYSAKDKRIYCIRTDAQFIYLHYYQL